MALSAIGLGVFVYDTWSQPDLALGVRLIGPLGYVVLGAFVGADAGALSWLGGAAGIALISIGLLAFRWTRDGGGPRWYYERVKQ